MLSLIGAKGQHREIGVHGALPWGEHLPRDSKWFRTNIAQKPVIVGRNTYHGLEKLLSNQPVYLLSKEAEATTENITVVRSVTELAPLQQSSEEAMVIGGGSVYAQLIDHARYLYITTVAAQFSEADTFFPEFNEANFRTIHSVSFEADSENQYACTFRILERRVPVKSLGD